MKITIELSDAQVKGIKHYLKEVGDIPNPKKGDIQSEMASIVHGTLQAPRCAIADYVAKYETSYSEPK